MYYVITDQKIIAEKSLKSLEKRHKFKIDDLDFTSIGNDYITKLSNKDIEFVQDTAKLNNIALNKLFKIDSTPKLILYIILALQFITMVKG